MLPPLTECHLVCLELDDTARLLLSSLDAKRAGACREPDDPRLLIQPLFHLHLECILTHSGTLRYGSLY